MTPFSLFLIIAWIVFCSRTWALRVTDYDYYDRLRQSQVDGHPNLLQSIEYAPTTRTVDGDMGDVAVEGSKTLNAGSGVFQSSDIVTNSHVIQVKDMQNATYRLANLAVFMPMSTRNDTSLVLEEMIMVLLAIHHFNNKELSPIFSSSLQSNASGGGGDDELLSSLQVAENCNVRLTADFYDTKSNAVKSTKDLSALLKRRHSLQHPLPSAIVGAFRSSVTSPLAILSSVDNVAQITAASTSDDFEDDEVYPLLARTCTSSYGEARAIVDYYSSIGVSRVAVLYMSDPFGAAMQKAFSTHAEDKGIQVSSVPFVYDKVEEISMAVQKLMDTLYQNVLVITFDSRYHDIMTAAHDLGMTGGNHAWTFYGINKQELQRQARYKQGSPLFEATKGIGVISLEEKFKSRVRYPDENNGEAAATRLALDPDDGDAPHITPATEGIRQAANVDKILASWAKAMGIAIDDNEKVAAAEEQGDVDLLDYLRTKLPIDGVLQHAELRPEPSTVWAYYLYDAITAMGIGMCSAEKEFFDGTHIMDRFSNIMFEGASGQVAFTNKNTRLHTSVQFIMWNFVPMKEVEKDGYNSFMLSPTSYYSNGEWSEIRPFVYQGGSNMRPLDLVSQNVDRDIVNRGAQISGLCAMSLNLVFSLVCLVFVIFYRLEPVVCASQHAFLLMICIGSFLQAAALIPFSMTDRDIGSKGLDIACMAVPWVYGIGLSVTTGALYIKTWRLYEVFRRPELDRIFVTRIDLAVWVSVVVIANGFILSLWTILDPLKYHDISDESTDVFGRHFASYGTCRPSQNSESSGPFGFSLWLLNIAALLVANWWSFKSRSIETEYFESRYNAFAIGTAFEALVIGGPVIHATSASPDAKYVVALGIISLTSFVTQALVFLPKMYAIVQDRNIAREEERKRRFSIFRERAAKSQEYEGHDTTNSTREQEPVEIIAIGTEIGRDGPSQQFSCNDSSRFLDPGGLRITHHPKTEDDKNSLTFSERCLVRNASASARHLRQASMRGARNFQHGAEQNK